MKLLEKILVPVKINEISTDQLNVAVQLATNFNSQIILLHVLPAEAKKESIHSLIIEYVNKDFEKVLTDLSVKGIKAEKRIQYGNLFEQIISVSETENVNLILLTNETEQTNKNQKIDVVTEKIIRKAQKPVWITKTGCTIIPKKILCPVDFSEASERALNNAIKISRIFKATLNIITVFEPLEENVSMRYEIDYKKENDELKKDTNQRFNEFIQKFNLTDIDYVTKLIKGKIHKKILDYAVKNKIDLIFMGANGKSLIQRFLLGSVTEMIIRELPVSMVITKSENILNSNIDS
ncbi:MAG: universal stress protein [Marinilabiliaceae bacterium]|nr:universal stress protein [Marinilabiliaceae bacterium]